MEPNNRSQRTPQFRPVCISQQWREAAAAERYAVIPGWACFSRYLAVSAVAVALATTGCAPSPSSLADSARKAGTAEQWRAWATQVIERSRTNAPPPVESEWPDFVQRVGAGRQL